jgi:hypothetical protein
MKPRYFQAAEREVWAPGVGEVTMNVVVDEHGQQCGGHYQSFDHAQAVAEHWNEIEALDAMGAEDLDA